LDETTNVVTIVNCGYEQYMSTTRDGKLQLEKAYIKGLSDWELKRIGEEDSDLFEIYIKDGSYLNNPKAIYLTVEKDGTWNVLTTKEKFQEGSPDRDRQVWKIEPNISKSLEDPVIAKGRVPISTMTSPTTVLEAIRYSGSQDSIMTAAYERGGRVRYDQTSATNVMYLGESPSSVILQTRARAPYRLGKPISSRQTFVLSEHKSGLVQRVGYFDEENGVFLQRSDDATGNVSVQLVLRNSASGRLVEEVVPQDKWNIDTMIGGGPSKIVADFDAIQTLVVDLDWLEGVADVGFVEGDTIAYAHRFQCNNSSKGVLTSSPSLPIRWELSSDVDNRDSVLRAVAGCVTADGNLGESAKKRTRTVQVDQLHSGFNSEFVAFRIRPDCLKLGGLALTGLGFDYPGGAKWRLTKNPDVFSDGDWQSFGQASVLQYCTSRKTATGSGDIVAEGRGFENFDVGPSSVIGGTVDGTPDVLSVEIDVYTDGYYPLTVSWKEFV
jgi:hypothetical protein